MIEAPPRVLIELGSSNVDGVGVFAVPNIRKTEKVADGIAEEDFQELIPWTSFERYGHDLQTKIMDFCIGTPEGFIPPENLDFNKLSIDWYLNHSCEGNCGFNYNGDFVALRSIERGEELTYDYALAESNPNFKMVCTCGTKRCRKIITGNDWKDEKFQARNQEHMLPHLRKLIPVHA
jgi:SET domain-containing protein